MVTTAARDRLQLDGARCMVVAVIERDRAAVVTGGRIAKFAIEVNGNLGTFAILGQTWQVGAKKPHLGAAVVSTGMDCVNSGTGCVGRQPILLFRIRCRAVDK